MPARPPPASQQLKAALQTSRELLGGHHAAGEEIAAHPIARVAHLECVGHGTVYECMQEESSPGTQPVVSARHHPTPVAHMLEHLDGNHAVELLAERELVDIRGHYPDAGQPLCRQLAF